MRDVNTKERVLGRGGRGGGRIHHNACSSFLDHVILTNVEAHIVYCYLFSFGERKDGLLFRSALFRFIPCLYLSYEMNVIRGFDILFSLGKKLEVPKNKNNKKEERQTFFLLA